MILLNPSIADSERDDPVVARQIVRASRWGHGGLIIMNVFARVCTDPRRLRRAHARGEDIVGPETNERLADLCRLSWPGSRLLLGWGNGAMIGDRVSEVLAIMHKHAANPWCLGVTLKGQPMHPLYVAYDRPLVPFPP